MVVPNRRSVIVLANENLPVWYATRPRGALSGHVVAQLLMRCGQAPHVCPLVRSEPRRRSCGGVLCEPAGMGGGGQGDVHPRVAQAPLDRGLAPGGDAEGTQRCELGRAGRSRRLTSHPSEAAPGSDDLPILTLRVRRSLAGGPNCSFRGPSHSVHGPGSAIMKRAI